MCDKVISHYNVVLFNDWDEAVEIIKCNTEEEAIEVAIALFDCADDDMPYKVGIEQVYKLINWWR